MKPLVAVNGKGGTGKSTLTALLVQQLVRDGVRPILAVDADPNYCLAELLGVELEGTMAELRDAAREKVNDPSGVSIASRIDLGLNEILCEGVGFDVLTMGQPEGPGCYCYINALLKDWLARTARNYAMCVVDNRAGLEHLSRLVTSEIDCLLIVAEPTRAAARAAGRVMELCASLPMKIGSRAIVWNKLRGQLPAAIREIAQEQNADASFEISWNDRLAEIYSDGQRLSPEDMPEIAKIAELCRNSLVKNP